MRLGDIYQHQLKARKAFKAYQEALLFDPDSEMIHQRLGAVWTELNNREKAGEHYGLAMSLGNDPLLPTMSFGHGHRERNRFQFAFQFDRDVKMVNRKYLPNMMDEMTLPQHRCSKFAHKCLLHTTFISIRLYRWGNAHTTQIHI